MKKIQCLFVFLFVCLISTDNFLVPALAASVSEDQRTITYFEDGSYLVTSITYDSFNIGRAAKQKSGTKHQDYYNSSCKLAWTFKVHGTFTYDGTHAEATDADYSYDIYDPAWSFDQGSAYCSDATAYADGCFKVLSLGNSVTVSLTCSPRGVLS